MSERFTEILRAASEPAWSDAVRHRFVNELFAGAVLDAVMARYLIQDHRFLDSFLTLLGAALASADTFEARLRFGRFIGIVSGEENTYFLRAFEALGVTEDRRASDPDLLLSHTALLGSRAMGPTPLTGRQVSPDHAPAIAETGGSVGIWHFFPSLDRYVDGLKEV